MLKRLLQVAAFGAAMIGTLTTSMTAFAGYAPIECREPGQFGSIYFLIYPRTDNHQASFPLSLFAGEYGRNRLADPEVILQVTPVRSGGCILGFAAVESSRAPFAFELQVPKQASEPSEDWILIQGKGSTSITNPWTGERQSLDLDDYECEVRWDFLRRVPECSSLF